jgi:dTDP-4-dehydrorhamnose 3,5-epimerase
VNTIETGIPGLIVIEPVVHGDARGFFMESWHSSRYQDAGIPGHFVQSNLSRSGPGVIRGLHYQFPHSQGKLLSVLDGRVFDVAVDIRTDSPTYRQWAVVELSAENHRQLYVPEGFAHGFCVLGETALLSYLCTEEYRADCDAAIAWDDPDIGIRWPIKDGRLSGKDSNAPLLRDVPADKLPRLLQ